MTEELFRTDSYLATCEAEIIALTPDGGIILDRTVFYPTGGGQPGDSGVLETANGQTIPVATTRYGEDRKAIVHIPVESAPAAQVGDKVTCKIDWDKRQLHMRVHTALHLLSAVLPYPVTGGQIGNGDGRLDFDIAESGLDKEAIAAELNDLVGRNLPVNMRWITDEELAAQPELVTTMSVKPPTGTGRVRLIEVADCDLQPCGGTHVAATGEIGPVRVTKIEKKGAHNRRVRIALESAG